MEILRVEDVGHKYQAENGEVTAFEHISFTVQKGEFMSIVGPSGCGKSTLLSIIAGLLPPTSGRVYVDGEVVTGISRHIGYMLQRDHLLEWRTLLSNVLFGREIRGAKTPQNVARAREDVYKRQTWTRGSMRSYMWQMGLEASLLPSLTRNTSMFR